MNGESRAVELTHEAQRDLKRLDPPARARVAQAPRDLAAYPERPGAVRKLTGAPEWRLRVGDWRALLLLDPERRLIIVTRVLPRGRAYER